MQNSFIYQGQQYDDQVWRNNYPGMLTDLKMEKVPPMGNNAWTQQTLMDPTGMYDPEFGLKEFRYYYASNTGIPGPYRPRPIKQSTPAAELMTGYGAGVHALFLQTEDLPHATADGKAQQAPFPLSEDKLIQEYNLVPMTHPDMAKEKCGCGGPMLMGGF
jgi:hypothetical protein